MIRINPFKVSLQLTKHNNDIEVRAEAHGGQAKCETSAPSESIIYKLLNKNIKDITNLPQTIFDSIGSELYKLLMVGDVRQLICESLKNGIEIKNPVHLELRFACYAELGITGIL